MKIVFSPDGNKILFSKNFSQDEVFSALCIDMKIKDPFNIVCDIRLTCKNAVLLFVKSTDRNLMTNPLNFEKKQEFLNKLKTVYNADAKRFIDTYNPKDLYSDINKKLNAYQMESLWIFRNRRFNLCSFEQGLGKTVFAASLSKIFNLKRTVVITPAVAKWNWYTDLTEEWGFNNLFFSILDREKTAYSLMEEHFVITNFESIDKFWNHIMREPIDHIVIDEAHYIKNHSTIKFKMVEKLLNANPKSRVTFLTGTPIKNRITDLFALLNISGNALGQNFMKFKERYAKFNSQKIYGIKNSEELRLRISNFMIRKKASEELNLPKLTIQKMFFDMSSQASKKYNELTEKIYQAEEQLIYVDKEIETLKQNISLGVTTNIETSSYLRELRTKQKSLRMESSGNLLKMNRLCSEAKIPEIIKLVKRLNEEGEKVIVFSFFKSTLAALKEHFKDTSVLIDGSVNSLKRRNNISEFINNENVKVFLGQNIAAGIGINLVNARYVLFCDLPLTPDLVEQPYKRSHRMGQKRDVEVLFALIQNSIDENIYGLIQSKMNDINETIDHEKKGNINYGSISKRLISDIIKKHEQENNIQNDKSRFVKV